MQQTWELFPKLISKIGKKLMLPHENQKKQSRHESVVTIWSANIKTAFKESLFPQKTKRSSRLRPRRSITRTLWSPSVPHHFIFGIPPKIQSVKRIRKKNK